MEKSPQKIDSLDFIPENYKYKVLSYKQVDSQNFECLLRVSLSNLDDCRLWLDRFKENTDTEWNLRNSKHCNESSKFVVNRFYVCHNASYRKKEKLQNGCLSRKNMKCGAYLSVKIKKSGKYVRYRDPCIKEGLRAIVRINSKHSHGIGDEKAHFYLKRSQDTTRAFITYFMADFSPALSIAHHEKRLLLESKDVKNRRINPPKAWVYALYDKWNKGLCSDIVEETQGTSLMTNSKLRSSGSTTIAGSHSNNRDIVGNLSSGRSGNSPLSSFMKQELSVKLEILENTRCEMLDRWDSEWDKLKLILRTSMHNKELVDHIKAFICAAHNTHTAAQLSRLLRELHTRKEKAQPVFMFLKKEVG